MKITFLPMKIYLVVGDSGDHGTYATWNVKAWTSKEEADAHAQRCAERVKLLSPWDVKQNPEDPNMQWDRSDLPRYFVDEIELGGGE